MWRYTRIARILHHTQPDQQQSASFKIDSDDEPLKLESALFTMFYPTNKKAIDGKKKLIKWFPRPFASTAYGYAKLAEISRTFAGTVLPLPVPNP